METATSAALCLLIGILLSHSVSPRGKFARTKGKFGPGHMPGWENFKRTGEVTPHFHGFFVFAYFCSGLFDLGLISTRNHRAAAPLLSISDRRVDLLP